MKEDQLALRRARLESAKSGEVSSAVDQLFDSALEELDSAIAESERDLNEADALYEEAEKAADDGPDPAG